MDELRDAGEFPDLFPDGTSQVVVQYDDNLPSHVRSVAVASHHKREASLEKVRAELLGKVVDPVLALLPKFLTDKTERNANHAGSFTIGGPAADIGLSGRKGVHDTYGTACAFGGSSPVGKDPTKTDRAALYMARFLAKNLVAAGVARRAEIRLVYLFGQRDPISVQVDTYGTGKAEEPAIAQALSEIVDLSSPGIVETLKLWKVRYAPLSCGGCFGRTEFDPPWERLDLVEKIKTVLG
jgi:S-adenosylmethionine synthetase